MLKKIIKYNKLEILFLCLLLSMCFQNIILINFSEFSFKLYHLISLFFIPLLIKNKSIVLPPLILIFFLFYLIIISILNIPNYGLDNLILNYIFSFYILIVVCTFRTKIDNLKFIEIMKVAACISLICVIIKGFVYRDVLIQFFHHPYGHPELPVFFGGGANLEATWISLFGFLFYEDKKGLIYVMLSTLISALYASRVGILASGLALLYLIFQNNKEKFNIKIRKYIYISIFLIIGFLIANQLGIFEYVISRFNNIGNEAGSLGRIKMWKYIIDAFKRNPFGYGLGNSIIAIEQVAGLDYSAGNVHNLFFQMLLDGGLIALIWYSILVIYFLLKEGKNFFKSPIVSFIIGYLMLSLFQFRGGDAIFFFVLGLYFNEKYSRFERKV